jgi:glycosyltransferase involved in cell wall biosynthesis
MKRMVESGWQVTSVAPLDRYSGRLSVNGMKYYPLDMSRKGLNPFSDVGMFCKLYGLYKDELPTLVHHFTIKPVIYGSVAARFTRIPAVVNAVTGLGHVYVEKGLKTAAVRAGVNTMYRFALNGRYVRVIFQNPEDRDALVSRRLLKSSQAVVIRGSGVDTEKFLPAPEPAGDPVIVLSARMLWSKGIGTLVDAARLLRKWHVRARIVIAGDADPGNPRSISEDRLLRWNKENIVTWLGHRDDMPDVFKNCHVVVLPTTYGEGVPRSLVEAASCGRPLVATDVPGCREIVRHGDNGFLVPPNDVKALAGALRTLVENPSLRKRMGARGRELVLATFAENHVMDSTLEVYEDLLGNKKP